MDLFSQHKSSVEPESVPLAERCRPKTLDDFVGHDEVVGENAALRRMLQQQRLKSLILWGPPGVGKTTLARIIAGMVKSDFISLSAVTAGVADIRKTIEKARQNREHFGKATILFIDEIHRFNKAQQDALLHVVEDGTITLIGATTENPSFEVISPLLSRCQVITLKPLKDEHIRQIITKALAGDPILSQKQIEIEDWDTLFYLADGDARRALNVLEQAVDLFGDTVETIRLNKTAFERAVQQKVLKYDKSGEYHYDLISAFIKSVRGSDPDAAVYWMARMLAAGEDPKFIARRLIILASEDIGNADPYALTLATNCFTAVTYIGMPECQIVLSQAATYLAAAPKSNASYMAIRKALEDVRNNPDVPVPLKLRNAPTGLMKQLDYGKDYLYAHDHPNHFVAELYLPDNVNQTIYYLPTEMGQERQLRERLFKLWKNLKPYPQSEKESNTHEPEK
jgi:putative ATPase